MQADSRDKKNNFIDIADVYLLGKSAESLSIENRHSSNYEFFGDEREKITVSSFLCLINPNAVRALTDKNVSQKGWQLFFGFLKGQIIASSM
jgi:hypothetical protein